MSDSLKSRIKRYAKAAEDAFFKVFELIPEIIGFIQIMISPLLIGILLGAVFYVAEPTGLGMILGGCTAAIGLVIGVLWAANEWKGKGTVWFMSRLMATPELDDAEEDDEDGNPIDRIEGK